MNLMNAAALFIDHLSTSVYVISAIKTDIELKRRSLYLQHLVSLLKYKVRELGEAMNETFFGVKKMERKVKQPVGGYAY